MHEENPYLGSCVQRIQPRVGANQYTCERLHCEHRRGPFRQWFESYYGSKIADNGKISAVAPEGKKSKHALRSLKKKQKSVDVQKPIVDQLNGGRLLAAISSRPGQSGRADGYILEGKELEFYQRQLNQKKGKKKN